MDAELPLEDPAPPPESGAAEPPAYALLTPTQRYLITACAMMATVMMTLDSTIANVAMPYMQGSMSASQDEISWMLTSYIVASAIMTAPLGYLAGRFGRTKTFVVSNAGFTIASVMCGMAQSLDQIILFRVLQGVFGAALVPLSQATLFDTYPPQQRASAMGIWVMGALIGPILGPTLGGWLTENYSWRWVFYINVPFGILATAGFMLFLKETPSNKSQHLDWVGFGSLSLAIGAFQMMLDRGQTLDWFASREIQVEAVLAALGFYIFLTQSLLTPKPFLSPKLFTDLNFVISCIFMFISGGILYATMALLAPYIQVLMNYPVSTAGLIMAPRGVGAMLAAVISGRLIARLGARPLVTFGFLMTAWSQYAMVKWTPDVSAWDIVYTGFIQGVGMSSISVPLANLSFATLPAQYRAEGAGVFNLLRNIGCAIGISVTADLLVSNTQVNHAIINNAVTPFNRALQAGAAADFWNPLTSWGAAALNGELTRQASIIAYCDDFKLMLIAAIVALPMVFLIRTARKPAVTAAE